MYVHVHCHHHVYWRDLRKLSTRVYGCGRRLRSTSVTNSAFLLAIVATPIDSAHSMYNAYTFCSCAQLSTENELVKIIEMF